MTAINLPSSGKTAPASRKPNASECALLCFALQTIADNRRTFEPFEGSTPGTLAEADDKECKEQTRKLSS